MYTINSCERVFDGSTFSAIDLRIAAVIGHAKCYRLTVQSKGTHPQRVEVLLLKSRAGVAWGGDATWIDRREGETAEDVALIVLNDADETERRA